MLKEETREAALGDLGLLIRLSTIHDYYNLP